MSHARRPGPVIPFPACRLEGPFRQCENATLDRVHETSTAPTCIFPDHRCEFPDTMRARTSIILLKKDKNVDMFLCFTRAHKALLEHIKCARGCILKLLNCETYLDLSHSHLDIPYRTEPHYGTHCHELVSVISHLSSFDNYL